MAMTSSARVSELRCNEPRLSPLTSPTCIGQATVRLLHIDDRPIQGRTEPQKPILAEDHRLFFADEHGFSSAVRGSCLRMGASRGTARRGLARDGFRRRSGRLRR